MTYLTNGTLLQGGKYKVVRHISSGGFGNTYEALDVNLNKRVALKEFFVKDFCSRSSDTTLVTITSSSKRPLILQLKKKFIEEARAIAEIEHENIVKVQALFEENDTAYYVMDYIEGESLGDLLKRRGSLTEHEALPIILKVADALAYIHRQNRFHLDVKPANIMLRNDGKVVLIDFGSSKQYTEVNGEDTMTMSPCYTNGYAPIEQMNPAPSKFTAATDIYALGATLYKMLTGLTPPSAISLMGRNQVLSPLPPEISANIKQCVKKAMEFHQGNRIQTIEEFVALLSVAKGSKKTWMTISLIAVALIVIVAIVFASHKQPSPTPTPIDTATTEYLVVDSDYQETVNDETNILKEDPQELANRLAEYVKEMNDLLENEEDVPDDYSVGPFAIEGRYLTCESFWFAEYMDSKEQYAETCMSWAIKLDPTNKMIRAAYNAGYSFKISLEIMNPHELRELTFGNSIFESVLPESEHKKH